MANELAVSGKSKLPSYGELLSTNLVRDTILSDSDVADPFKSSISPFVAENYFPEQMSSSMWVLPLLTNREFQHPSTAVAQPYISDGRRMVTFYAYLEHKMNDNLFRTNETMNALSWQIVQLTKRLSYLESSNIQGAASIGFHSSPAQPDQDDVLSARNPKEVAGEKIEGDLWADAFDAIADECMYYRRDFIEFAREGLQSQDPSVRSSASRAVAILVPAEAIKLLSGIIQSEHNEYVKASLLASLQSAILQSARS